MFQGQLGGSPILGLSERTKQKIAELDPRFRPQITALMTRATQMGLRPEIAEAYRSQERQDQLYEQGRTTPGAKVTGTRSSMHTKRLAVDIYQRDEKGKIDLSPEPGFYQAMSQIAQSIGGINWGGNWKTPDKPHFQWKAR
jgi:peptidoglycan L-alanyl-D-glutamate endopeptidase CwlK